MPSAEIGSETTMGEILSAYPAARLGLFRRYHIGGCTSCGYQLIDTLEQVRRQYNINDPVETIATVIRESSAAEAKLQILPATWIANPKQGRFLDARTPEEFQKGRIPGAELLTVERIFEILDSWPKDTPIILYSNHGRRSLERASYLTAYGFTNAKNLAGGLEAWSGEWEVSCPRTP